MDGKLVLKDQRQMAGLFLELADAHLRGCTVTISGVNSNGGLAPEGTLAISQHDKHRRMVKRVWIGPRGAVKGGPIL